MVYITPVTAIAAAAANGKSRFRGYLRKRLFAVNAPDYQLFIFFADDS